MDISMKDIVTLDNEKKYLVASKVNYKKDNYYYLVNVEDKKDVLLCFMEDDDLVELGYKKLLKKLIPLFFKKERETAWASSN